MRTPASVRACTYVPRCVAPFFGAGAVRAWGACCIMPRRRRQTHSAWHAGAGDSRGTAVGAARLHVWRTRALCAHLGLTRCGAVSLTLNATRRMHAHTRAHARPCAHTRTRTRAHRRRSAVRRSNSTATSKSPTASTGSSPRASVCCGSGATRTRTSTRTRRAAACTGAPRLLSLSRAFVHAHTHVHTSPHARIDLRRRTEACATALTLLRARAHARAPPLTHTRVRVHPCTRAYAGTPTHTVWFSLALLPSFSRAQVPAQPARALGAQPRDGLRPRARLRAR